jgi:ParB family transcriptional regulator, chromosome partitioning protein
MNTATAENLAANKTERKEAKVEKRKALGRGLESLLPGPRAVTPPNEERTASADLASLGGRPASFPAPTTASPSADASAPRQVISIEASTAETSPPEVIASLPLDAIDKNPYQTRYLFDEAQLTELCDSIREHGVVQPVVVRPASQEGRYILVLGERRLRASKMAGKETIPGMIRKLSPQQAAEMTVLENVVREDLNPIEQAEAYRVLSQEFNLTQAQIAQRIGASRESVANYLRLLRLPEEVRDYVAQGQIGFSQARELLALENPEYIGVVARELIGGQTRWGDLQERVAWLNGPVQSAPSASAQPQPKARWVDPNVLAAQAEMQQLLGLRVKIKDQRGHGSIVIEYSSVDDYERIVEIVRSGSHSSKL